MASSGETKHPTTLLERAEIISLYTILKQRCLHWLGHVSCVEEGQIPKDFLYEELATGMRSTGIPQLCFRDICKHHLRTLAINTDTWEVLECDICAGDRRC